MTESILIIGGYGVVGRRIAADLAPEFPGGVIVAGRHLDQAQRAAATIGYAVRGRQVDVRQPSSIAAALRGVSIAVNCIDQPERGLLWATARQGLGYTDITPHLTDLGQDAYERVDAAARASGARIVLGSGLVPGISSVIVKSLADALGGADRIETSVLLSADDVSGAASFDYMMQELAMAFTIHVDGADKPARPYTKPRLIYYPAPIGARRGYLFPFSDQALYPRTMGARTVITRLTVDPPRMSRLLALLAATHASGIAARPRIRAALSRLRQARASDTYAPYALRVDVTHDGRTATATLTGSGQAQATAAGAAGVVRSLATAEISQPGAWMPEQVIAPGPYLDRLALAGLHVHTTASAHHTR